MKYIQEQTPSQLRQSDRDSSVIKTGEAVNHAISVMCAGNKKFWSAPSEQLVADLNANPEQSIALMTGNTTLGTALNEHQDKLDLRDAQDNPKYTRRVPLVIGDPTITIVDGVFVYTEPVAEPVE